jgi:hypothetical protein
MVLHEEGFIVVCCLCDSYFVLTTGLVAPASYRGKAGTAKLDNRNVQTQQSFSERTWVMLRCPTCVELAFGMPYLDWIEEYARDASTPTPLCPCFFASFEDDQLSPLYMDHKPAGEAGKPKWRLASGVGPAGLEMDMSKSGRIWKPSLKPVGIVAPRYTGAAADKGYHADILQCVETGLAFLGGDDADALYEALKAARPCYAPHGWQTVGELVGSAVEESDEAKRNSERAQQRTWSEKRRRDHLLVEMMQMGIAELS